MLLVTYADVFINIAALFGPMVAVRTLEARILPAHVQKVSSEAIPKFETAPAGRTTVIDNLGRLLRHTCVF